MEGADTHFRRGRGTIGCLKNGEAPTIRSPEQPLVEKFLLTRADKAAATRNHSVRALRRALHVACEKFGYIASVPKFSLRDDEHKRGDEALVNEAQFQLLLKNIRPPLSKLASTDEGWRTDNPATTRETLQTLLVVLYDCGLRLGEALRLKRKNVDFETRLLFVEFGKTKKARRRLAMTERVMDALKALIAANPDKVYLFTRTDYDTPLSVGYCSHAFTNTRRRVLPDEDGIVCHSLRHSCSTRLAAAGANVMDLLNFMGWESVSIAERYCHADPDRARAVSALLEPKVKKA